MKTTMRDLKTAVREVLTEDEVRELEGGALVKAVAKAFWRMSGNADTDGCFRDPQKVVDPILDGVSLGKNGFLDGHLF